jgi:NAD(P)-dependent dehydrogenase (short-subunit alcohol dehydrogenase family)
VKCDTTSWEDQVKLFDEAKSFSNNGGIHYVVANAGITKQDDVFAYDESGPKKPDLKIIDVNIHGAMYTLSLKTARSKRASRRILVSSLSAAELVTWIVRGLLNIRLRNTG